MMCSNILKKTFFIRNSLQYYNTKTKYVVHPRSIRPGRKRPFLILFDSFGSKHITGVFHRIVNERKRQYTFWFFTITTVVIIVLGTRLSSPKYLSTIKSILYSPVISGLTDCILKQASLNIILFSSC
jgi:hypothetical protein